MTLGSNLWIELGVAFVCFRYFSSKRAFNVTVPSVVASILLIASSVYYVHGGSIPGYISKIMLVSLAALLINVKVDWRMELWQTISKWYAVLVLLAVVFWLLHFVFPLPHATMIGDMNGTPIHSYNYFFFRETMFNEYRTDWMQRFQGMFLEPGHMGTITAFFLLINRFAFHKIENWILLIGTLLSLSASAYLLLVLGYMSHMVAGGNARKVLYAVLLIVCMVVFSIFYNDGNNLINELIFEKLTREEGAMESRVSLEVLMLFENMWSTGTDLWYGKGAFLDIEENSAGFMLFFVCCGIVGTILLVLAYFSIYYSCKTKYGFFLFLIYMISFLQRTYPYFDAFSLPFILGLPYFLQEQRKKIKSCKQQKQIKGIVLP